MSEPMFPPVRKPTSPAALFSIEEERAQQIVKWGGDDHDDTHTFFDWTSYCVRHLGRAVIYRSDLSLGDLPVRSGDDWRAFRRAMVRVAALAIAAIESADRKLAQR